MVSVGVDLHSEKEEVDLLAPQSAKSRKPEGPQEVDSANLTRAGFAKRSCAGVALAGVARRGGRRFDRPLG
jgi:hypothetical protein